MNLVEWAVKLATELHAGQIDRAGQPYILHPLRVGAMGLTPQTQIVGFMHDTVEDCQYSLANARSDFGLEIAEALASVTKVAGEPYDEFIRRASLNKIGHIVKLNDLYDNTRHERKCLLHKSVAARLIPKYEAAIKYLEEHL